MKRGILISMSTVFDREINIFVRSPNFTTEGRSVVLK